jgi:hypothetical protein
MTSIAVRSFIRCDNFRIVFQSLPDAIDRGIRGRMPDFESRRICISALLITRIDLHSFIRYDNCRILFQSLHEFVESDIRSGQQTCDLCDTAFDGCSSLHSLFIPASDQFCDCYWVRYF